MNFRGWKVESWSTSLADCGIFLNGPRLDWVSVGQAGDLIAATCRASRDMALGSHPCQNPSNPAAEKVVSFQTIITLQQKLI